MKELIYPFHIQAENRRCFLLLTYEYPEQLSASKPALLQVRLCLFQAALDTAGRSQSPVVLTGELPAADLGVCSCILGKGQTSIRSCLCGAFVTFPFCCLVVPLLSGLHWGGVFCSFGVTSLSLLSYSFSWSSLCFSLCEQNGMLYPKLQWAFPPLNTI